METSDPCRPEGSAQYDFSPHNTLCRPEARHHFVKDISDHVVLVYDPVADVLAALAPEILVLDDIIWCRVARIPPKTPGPFKVPDLLQCPQNMWDAGSLL